METHNAITVDMRVNGKEELQDAADIILEIVPNVTVRNNSTSARGDAVYVTNGSGKTTTFTIYSATFDQPNRPCIDIGNSGTSVIVHKPGVTDVNHDPVDYSLIITGSSNYATTKVTYEET